MNKCGNRRIFKEWFKSIPCITKNRFCLHRVGLGGYEIAFLDAKEPKVKHRPDKIRFRSPHLSTKKVAKHGDLFIKTAFTQAASDHTFEANAHAPPSIIGYAMRGNMRISDASGL